MIGLLSRPADAAAGEGPAPPRRRIRSRVLTVLAGVLVFAALTVPEHITRLAPGSFLPGAFVRIPVEGIAGLALLLVLPARARRRAAAVLGALLGLLTVLKIVDVGFFAALARPFDPVLDWVLFDDAVHFLTESYGRTGAYGAVTGAAVLAVTVVVAVTAAVRRLTAVADRHRTATTRGGVALAAAWVVCTMLGAHIVPGVPIASDTAAALAYDKAVLLPEGLQDRRRFTAEVAVDAFRDVPADRLLTGLRDLDVVVAFVESYGRDAIEDPELDRTVGPVLADGGRRLAAAGFGARSGFLTSPTAGGGSWLAHATFLSGLWVDNQQRYRSLVSSDRLTLTSAFARTQRRTVGIEPANTYAWPEGDFYGYDKVYDAHGLGYAGPKFDWSTMPDQFALAAFQRAEYGLPGRGRLMAEVTLTSSHTPWATIPSMVDWNQLGDGRIFGPQAAAGEAPDLLGRDPARVRDAYARSVAYSMESVVSWAERYGGDDLVLVVLGDHQPAPVVTGQDATRDVPITVVSKNPAALARIAGWGWDDGIRPSPQAPVWRMDAFRDRFLTAYAQ